MATKQCRAGDVLEDKGILPSAKYAFNPTGVYKPDVKALTAFMTDMDGTQACNRFKWVGLPNSIPKWQVEQKLYWRTALCLFKFGKNYKLLPFTAVGGLNLDGLMQRAIPIPYNGGATDGKGTGGVLFKELKVYNYQGDVDDVPIEDRCVILYDRINGFATSGTSGVPKAVLQQYIIKEIVNRLSMLNVNLVNSQGKNIIIVKDPKQASAVDKALQSVYASDKAYSIVKSLFEIQVINNDITYEEQALWEDIQSWNNLRLDGLGIDNNGLFNKKERQLNMESSADNAQVEVITDAFYEARKLFVKQAKECFGDDPDFVEQFKGLDVIDLRIAGERVELKKDNQKEESDDDNGISIDTFDV